MLTAKKKKKNAITKQDQPFVQRVEAQQQ